MRRHRALLAFCFFLGSGVVAVAIGAYFTFGSFEIELPVSLTGQEPGALVKATRTGKYPRFLTQSLLATADLPEPLDMRSGITTYRVQYRTTNYDGSAIIASGLVAIPDISRLSSVVMYLHGTNAERATAPSQSGLGEGTLIAAAVAGTGHILLAPDYIGLGESHAHHVYMHAPTTVSSSVDFIHAAARLVEHLHRQWPTSFYLMGFSQGGHAALALQRALEQRHDPQANVKAAAAIAGPFYLRDLSFPHALTGKTKSHAFYLAYLSDSYARIYGHPLNSLLQPPYAENVPVLFDGNHASEEISASLPEDPRALFTDDFLNAYDHGESHWFLAALADNDVYDWTPVAPIRLYFGDDDVDVLPEESRRTATTMQARGADVTAVSVGASAHDASAYRGIPAAIRWFTELSNPPSLPKNRSED